MISRDADGKAMRMNGVTVDITERKRAEERQLVLAREVDHRAKNMLAVVLSVLRLTKAKSTPEFVSTVEGRIHALAATHNLLSATRWQGANLSQIVDEELAPYRTDHRQRIEAGGPPAMLLPATAQAVALALHELATNAAKYGALSTDTGHLRLVWTIDDEALVVDWTETGGPPAAEPKSLGFGLSIVRSSIEAQFRGGVLYEWRPEGLHCRLSIPRAQIVGPTRGAEAGDGKPARGLEPSGRRSLAGRRLLMVEDEVLVGMMAKRILEDLGATVLGPYGGLADGLAAARSERFDGALLDFNLAGELADPLADLLIARGVPFIFITGYQRDSIDRRYANIPVLPKPLEAESLERVLVSLARTTTRVASAEGLRDPPTARETGRSRGGSRRNRALRFQLSQRPPVITVNRIEVMHDMARHPNHAQRPDCAAHSGRARVIAGIGRRHGARRCRKNIAFACFISP